MPKSAAPDLRADAARLEHAFVSPTWAEAARSGLAVSVRNSRNFAHNIVQIPLHLISIPRVKKPHVVYVAS
jgi:hypothetical protein